MPLRAPARLFWALINLGLGLLPSLAFFVWVERNASLPWAGAQLGWPWLSVQSWPVPWLVAWDMGLFFAFGLLHSIAAQSRVQKALARAIPIQAMRTFYMALTGLSLLCLMGLWQNTGIVLWLIPAGTFAVNALSLLLFWGLLAVAGFTLRRFDPLSFVGVKQLYASSSELTRSEGSPRLETAGVYARVRHPLYTFTTSAFALTPFLTLDRAVLVAAMGLYLFFAIPVEERKLVALFGSAYEEYRLKVPAVIPRLSK